jgi:hypothetical protein
MCRRDRRDGRTAFADDEWFDRADHARIAIPALGNGDDEMRILPGMIDCERIGVAVA